MGVRFAKRFRKEVRKMQPDVVQMFDSLKKWPFKMRLSMAWELVKGVSRKAAKSAKVEP